MADANGSWSRVRRGKSSSPVRLAGEGHAYHFGRVAVSTEDPGNLPKRESVGEDVVNDGNSLPSRPRGIWDAERCTKRAFGVRAPLLVTHAGHLLRVSDLYD